MSFIRIYGLFLRHFYLITRSFPRILDLIYWPSIQITLWGFISTFFATALGTIAALGLSRPHMPYKGIIMSILISPMIVPLIITAAGMFFFYARFNLVYTFTGIIMAHIALATPFVVITVTATLVGFDTNMIKASQSLGARPGYFF